MYALNERLPIPEDPKPYRNVCLIGHSQSGKNTVASLLQVIDPTFSQVAYADQMKLQLSMMLAQAANSLDFKDRMKQQFTSEDFMRDFQDHKEKYRPLFQWFGTDFVRSIDPNYWVQELRGSAKYRRGLAKGRIVFTDARFENEISTLPSSTLILKVLRVVPRGNHESETTVDTLPYHISIDNNGTLIDLLESIQEIYDLYLDTSC